MNFERFIDRTDDCWIWTGRIDRYGYGRLGDKLAHRLVYEAYVGPIPPGLDSDHLCHTNDPDCDKGTACPHRRCVNPDHLDFVTREENGRRQYSARKQVCKNGHPLDESNTRMKSRNETGKRGCRQCNKEAVWKHKLRLRGITNADN